MMQTGEGICVIDLDTVMPGLAAYDFGDMVRTMTCPAAEDEQDLSRVAMEFALFEAVLRGYLEGAGSFLTAQERESLIAGAKVIVFEQGIRFLVGPSCRGHLLQGQQAGTESRPLPDAVQASGIDRAAGSDDDVVGAAACPPPQDVIPCAPVSDRDLVAHLRLTASYPADASRLRRTGFAA